MFLKVLLLVPSVQCFPEEDPKLLEIFLIGIPASSKKGLLRYRRTCWISPRELVSFVPSYLFGGSPILSCGFFFGLFFPCSPRTLGDFPKLLEGLIYDCELRPRKSSTFLLFPSSYYGEGVYGNFPLSLNGLFVLAVFPHVL